LLVALRPLGNRARGAPASAPPPLSRPDIVEQRLRAGHQPFVQQALASIVRAERSLTHGSSAKQ
jgi:hypothetical protein